MRSRVSSDWPSTSEAIRTVPRCRARQKSSNDLTGCVNATRRTSTSTRPCPSKRRRNSPSSENRKTSGPGGRPSGGPAPASPTASRNTPNMRISAGTSQVVSANRPPGARTRTPSATASSGRPKWGSPKLPTTASKAPSSNGSDCASARLNSTSGCSASARATIASATSTPHTVAPRRAASAATYPGPVATSSTRVPGPTRATSRSGSTSRPVTAPKNPAYPSTRSSHALASNSIERVEIDAHLIARHCPLPSRNAQRAYARAGGAATGRGRT